MGFLDTAFIFAVLPHTHTGNSGGQVQPVQSCRRVFLMILSSREWKEITASRPPGLRWSQAASSMGGRASSSPFTAMRMAWKLRLAGCCFSRSAWGGMAARISSTSSAVVSMGELSRAWQIFLAMAGAYRSSP